MKKLTISAVKADEILSKEERKNIIGGDNWGSSITVDGGRCEDGTAAWRYPTRVTYGRCKSDIIKHCRNGKGTCDNPSGWLY